MQITSKPSTAIAGNSCEPSHGLQPGSTAKPSSSHQRTITGSCSENSAILKTHGNPNHYQAYFPKYLMKALQDHCRHHREALYLKLKHASYTIDHLAKNIQPAEPNQHTQTMAAAHDLLRQKQRSQKTNRHQMTLGL